VGGCLVAITGEEFFFFTHNGLEKQFMLNLTYFLVVVDRSGHTAPYYLAKLQKIPENPLSATIKYTKFQHMLASSGENSHAIITDYW